MRSIPPKFRFLAVVALAGCVVTAAMIFSVNTVIAQYTGNENHTITLDQAAKYVQNFKNNPTAPAIKGGYFGRNIFEKILAQTGCVGIRYYYAKMDDGSPTLVLVGVDGNGHDMTQGVLGEVIIPCPPFCDSPNQLNK